MIIAPNTNMIIIANAISTRANMIGIMIAPPINGFVLVIIGIDIIIGIVDRAHFMVMSIIVRA